MIIDTLEALERYNIARSTFMQNKYQNIIINAQGRLPSTGSGRERYLYKTSVLDKLAREGKLGSNPRKAILNKDTAKEQAS